MPQRPEFLKPGQPVRLQAFLARSGLSSRRGAEEMIAHGRVAVNGHEVTAMGTTVRPGVDRVTVDGEEVKVAPITWVALHKPRGFVTSRDDPFGRRTVYELLPEKFHGLFHVGRLDRDSEGILLLTNDGELAHRLLHPSFGVTKEYDVVVPGKPSDAVLRQLVEGVELEDGIARAESAKLMGPAGNGLSRLKIVLREGKKREVRRMLEALGHPVRRLIRRRFGPITLAELPPGKYRIVAPEELTEGHRARRSEREAAARPEAGAPRRKSAGTRPRPQGAEEEARPARAPRRKPGFKGPARGGKPRAKAGAEDARQERAPRRPPAERPSRGGEEAPARGGDSPPRRSSAPEPPPRGSKGRPGAPARPGAPTRPGAPSRASRPRRDDDDAQQERAPRRPPAERPSRGGEEGPGRGPKRPTGGPKGGGKPGGKSGGKGAKGERPPQATKRERNTEGRRAGQKRGDKGR